MSAINVNIQLEKDAIKPVKQHIGDAAFDCYTNEAVLIEPDRITTVSLGFRLELPSGYEAQIRPRSGNSLKTDIDVILGTVDSNYRGIVKAIVHNRSKTEQLLIEPGKAVCQMVIQEIPPVLLNVVDQIDLDTDRGDNGFGSTSIVK